MLRHLLSLAVLCSVPACAQSRFTVDDMLDVSNVAVADVSKDGRWIAATSSSLRDRIGIDNSRFGDLTYIAPHAMDLLVIDAQTGATQKVFTDRRQVRAAKWSPDGSRLALFALAGDRFRPMVWNRESRRAEIVTLPAGQDSDDAGDLEWTSDGGRLLVPVHSAEWRAQARAQFLRETEAPVVFHSSKEPFLAWIDLRRRSLDRSLAAWDVNTHATTVVLEPLMLSSYRVAEDGTFITVQQDIGKKTDYDLIGGGDDSVSIVPAADRSARVIVKSTKGLTLIRSRNDRFYAYSKDGAVFFASIDDKEPRQILGPKKPAADAPKAEPDLEKAKEEKSKERFTAVRLSPKGDHMVASNKEGLWLVDTASGSKDLFLKMSEDDKAAPRYQVTEWSPGGDTIYLTYSSRTKWERGLVRYDVKSRKLEDLVKDGRIFGGFRLSNDGTRWTYTAAEGNRPPDIFTADANFREQRRLTESNPQLKQKALAKTQLLSYYDADGKKEFAVAYLPPDYREGRKYPTVVQVYEQFFDETFNGTINVLTANGYVVMQPSVEFETGFPGEAWLKGVTSAVNKAVEMGIADPDLLGVQGTSYGGYATNLLITQTHRFKAAINISGKVDMVSFYTDSPRLGTRNIHAPEKSQDRIGATLWQQPQKYLQNSAIFYADRITTPLLLMCGEQDSNVPPRQLMEMYYAMRRLGKEVAWVSYTKGGHGMPTSTVEEVKDYHQRILDWYAEHLKPKSASATESGN
jgi:dipeptidyl aminopeptidase/acylaminoacyl peptidase